MLSFFLDHDSRQHDKISKPLTFRQFWTDFNMMRKTTLPNRWYEHFADSILGQHLSLVGRSVCLGWSIGRSVLVGWSVRLSVIISIFISHAPIGALVFPGLFSDPCSRHQIPKPLPFLADFLLKIYVLTISGRAVPHDRYFNISICLTSALNSLNH